MTTAEVTPFDSSKKIKLENPRTKERIIFDVAPEVIENRNINYKAIDPIHAPGQFQAYANTGSRTFNLTQIKLVSRTSDEATKNLMYLRALRSWTMPSFGQVDDPEKDSVPGIFDSTNGEYSKYVAADYNTLITATLGLPPPVLLFSAYSNSSVNLTQHLRKIPVLISNLTIPYPTDVDYIPTTKLNGTEGHTVPMPTIMVLDMILTETHSPNQYNTFSLDKFRAGILDGF